MTKSPVMQRHERNPEVGPLGFVSIAHRDPNRMAIIEPAGRQITYGALAQRINQLSHLLRSYGLQPGDCVAAVLPNRREYHELRLATGQTGLYFAPINHHLTATEIAHILTDSEAKVIVVDASLLDVVEPALPESGVLRERCLVVGESADWANYEQLLGTHPSTVSEPLLAGDYMGYTSGTTGRPKGVRKPLTGKPPTVAAALVDYMARLDIRPGSEVHLVGGPLSHAAPGTYSTIALQFGHTVVIAERPTPEEILQLIEKYRVSITFTVPTVMGRLLRLPQDIRDTYDTSSLKSVVHAGAPCPVAVKRQVIEWLGPVVMEFYGATEGSATALTAREWLAKPGSVGYPIPGGEVRIFDGAGTQLPTGEIGAVYYRPAARVEYFKDPEKTRAAYRGDLVTAGDLGYVDEDGWLFLADRRADLILSGGVNIYPAEVEAALLTSPLIADAAVIGIDDEDWGQRVAAVVQLERGVQTNERLPHALIEHCRSVLAGFKVPRQVEFVEILPRNSTGKLLRRQLREEFGSGPYKRSTQ